MTEQAKVTTILLIVAFVCVFAVFVVRGCDPLLLLGLGGRTPEESVAFDPNLWKRDTQAAFADANYDEIYSATRDLMVDDLLERHKLVGMRSEEVIALLGKPDFSRSLPFPEWDLIYWLGPDHRSWVGHLDSLWLVMKCDPNGVVLACQKTYD
jgi:hypothetical protein